MAGYQDSILKPGLEICSPAPLAFSEDWRYQRSLRLATRSNGPRIMVPGSSRSCLEYVPWHRPAGGNPASAARMARAATLRRKVLNDGEWSVVMTPPVSRIHRLYRKERGRPHCP